MVTPAPPVVAAVVSPAALPLRRRPRVPDIGSGRLTIGPSTSGRAKPFADLGKAAGVPDDIWTPVALAYRLARVASIGRDSLPAHLPVLLDGNVAGLPSLAQALAAQPAVTIAGADSHRLAALLDLRLLLSAFDALVSLGASAASLGTGGSVALDLGAVGAALFARFDALVVAVGRLRNRRSSCCGCKENGEKKFTHGGTSIVRVNEGPYSLSRLAVAEPLRLPRHSLSLANGRAAAHRLAVAIIDTKAGRIGVEERGSGGTAILFLHGVGSDKSVWAPQLEHFGASRRAVAFDYPGYGESDPVPEGASRDDFAAAILAGMDSLDISTAHICGLSLGGVIAIAIHSAAPERCQSLILADTFAVHPDGQEIYDRAVAASADLRKLAEARVDVLLAQPADPGVRAQVVETMAAIDPAAYRAGAEAVWLADQRDRASAIDVPALILCGTEDKVTPPELSNELAGLVPRARYALIERAGHLCNLERPAEFNRIIGGFING